MVEGVNPVAVVEMSVAAEHLAHHVLAVLVEVFGEAGGFADPLGALGVGEGGEGSVEGCGAGGDGWGGLGAWCACEGAGGVVGGVAGGEGG